MPDERAKRIKIMQEREAAKAARFMNLYQEVADQMLPRENQITSTRTPGEDKSKKIYDPTAMMDLEDMVSGFISVFFPAEQLPFAFVPEDKSLAGLDHVRAYLSRAAVQTYEAMMASNFMTQLHESMSSLIGFGTCCLFSEWNRKIGKLNYKDWDVAHFTFKQDVRGIPDTTILKYPLTARQAVDQFGDNAGTDCLVAVQKLEDESKVFEFIHLVRPRIIRNVMLIDGLNMPFESLYVNVKEESVVDEGGFEENPFAVARWKRTSSEKYGRGQGTVALSAVKELQQMHCNLVECGDKWNNPPKEVLEHFEGTVKVTPGGLNFVREKGTIRGIEQTALGNFPISKEILQFQQEIIHKAFFVDVFAPLANLSGDRRTTVEIIERVKQAMKKLAGPVYRSQTELFSPAIIRSFLLLVRNGRIGYPPPELQGQGFSVEYIGELALALRDQQARAFQQWAQVVVGLEGIFPEAKDNINIDNAYRRIGRSFGINEDDLATEDEVAAKRQARAKQLALQQALQAGASIAEGYGKTTKSPEEGSPAEKLMAGLGV